MINTVKAIFEDIGTFNIEAINFLFGYEGIDGFVGIRNSDNKIEAYMILQVNDLSIFFEETDNKLDFETLHVKLKEQEYYQQELNKNVSLIILLDTGNEIGEKLKRQILEIEEDPYYFKKYVLQYTAEQHNNLIEKCPSINIADLRELVLGVDFEGYKEKTITDAYIKLLLNLYVKLPFLNVPYSSQELPNLTETIVNRLRQSPEQEDLIMYRESIIDDEESNIYDLFEIPKELTEDE